MHVGRIGLILYHVLDGLVVYFRVQGLEGHNAVAIQALRSKGAGGTETCNPLSTATNGVPEASTPHAIILLFNMVHLFG